ncbi:zinc knuckle-domain-containing protein [Rhexocercosporidium sp. MPI-PUGE-AT-0058]|nr:zinc knuckle-domain-containing protein [Rhexocercosporidium sp. MPI-PUGE-AT-0058]
MNRYARGPTIGGPSKATATTLCQKCLKKGHYSYECKAVVQERPYVSRPSRTQQLLNPKLQPKLTSEAPQDLLRKKGVANELLAKADQDRGRKRDRMSEDPELGASKRMRSASSTSISTISTTISRSSSLQRDFKEHNRRKVGSRNASPPLHRRSPSLTPPRRLTDSEKKRRRDSLSSVDSYSSDEGNMARERVESRSTRRRYQQASPPARGRTTESRSPHRNRRDLSNDRRRARNGLGGVENTLPPKERSLSPFSKRLALTQTMNGGR